MNVSELYSLTLWIEREFEEKSLLQKYVELRDVLNYNVQPNQPKQPFDTQKTNLLTALRQFNLSQLTVAQLTFLDSVGIAKHLGTRGADEIEDILFRNSLDAATAAQRVSEIYGTVSNGVNRAKQVKDSLDGLVKMVPSSTDEALLRITFAREAAITDVAALKKWANDWHDIGRGIAMAHGYTPQDVRVVGATSGSIILELAVVYALAHTVSLVLLKACDVAQRYLNLKKTAEEIRGLKLSNDKAAQDIEKEADSEKMQAIDEISAQILSELRKTSKTHGEDAKALDKAVRKLVSFVQQGGEVDCVLPDVPAETPESTDQDKARIATIRKLQASFQSIRALEDKVRLLGVTYKDPEEKPGPGS